MFGRIRPSSLLETLEGSPSKILKDDSYSIFEATLMKLKLGAQRDTSAFSKEADEIMMIDSAISPTCVEGTNVVSNCISASASSSHQHAPNLADDASMMIDSDCSTISASPSRDQVSTATSEQPRENDRPASVSPNSSERNYRSETESIQSSPVSELME